MEAKPAEGFRCKDGLIEAREMEWWVLPVGASSEVHDLEFLWLDAQADVQEGLLEDGVGVLEPGCVDGEGGGGEENAIIDIG